MLLVLDVGNTETEVGLFPMREDGTAGPELTAQWRISTAQKQTADEYGVLMRQLFAMRELELSAVHGIIVASVVPPLERLLRQMSERYFGLKALFIEPGIKTGMPVHYDNPAEVGADRIVNAVAAYEKCKAELRGGGLWHGDDVRRGFGAGRIPGRGDRSGDRDLGRGAV